MIRALEALPIRPDLIAGTSAGGIIGAMVAAGLSVDQIEASIRAASLAILAAREPSHLGLVGRDRFAHWLHGVLERTIAIMQDGHLRDKLAQSPPDVMLCPQVGEVGLFDSRHLDGCVQAGVAEVHAHEAELVVLRDRVARRPSWLERFCKRLRGAA